jgi:hypothetical protein
MSDKSKYLDYLPSVLSEQEAPTELSLGSMLLIFEKVLTGIDDGVEILGLPLGSRSSFPLAKENSYGMMSINGARSRRRLPEFTGSGGSKKASINICSCLL